MLFTVALYAALAIFFIGLVYRIWTWFSLRVGPDASMYTLGQRCLAFATGVLTTLFSSRLPRLVKILVLDIGLQTRVLREDFYRWLMHICIFVGFVALLLMHALDEPITAKLFRDYNSTLNPYLVLRNVFGVLLAVGLGMAIYRRWAMPPRKGVRRGVDHISLALLVVIAVSGFFLEGAKIVSEPVFDRMVEDFSDTDDPDELATLRAYWAEEFGVVFAEPIETDDPDALEQGRDIHEMSCAGCHSAPQGAFVSYPLAKVMSPVAQVLNRSRADLWMWYIHFLACFALLAYAPFSRMLHVVSSPVSLIWNGLDDPTRQKRPANDVTRRAMELDACTRCGACSQHCSVASVFDRLTNANILPSEKILAVKAFFAGESLTPRQIHAIQEGNFVCTGCYRCTKVCPAGINLQDLWATAKQQLAAQGYPEPQIWAKEQGAAKFADLSKNLDATISVNGHSMRTRLRNSLLSGTFSHCFKCRTCSNVCPVLSATDNLREDLGLMPHQVMHCLGMGLPDLALDSRMIWECLTCYQCQENCPQGVNVTDIFYELKNMAYERLRAAELDGKTSLPDRSRAGMEEVES